MKLSDLRFDYPEELIATEPVRPTRVMWVDQTSEPIEITVSDLLRKIPSGDVLVINNTKVLKRRVFTQSETEVLFLDKVEDRAHSNVWKVLFPSKKYKVGDELDLPKGFSMRLLEKGRPQLVEVTPAISDEDFALIAELPLPPYIQRARDERHNLQADERWYQTAWASRAGSMAAPTASLHFSHDDLEALRANGVQVVQLTLHVGLGTFLPVTTENLNDHQMHAEEYEVEAGVWAKIEAARKSGHKIWSLGTTTTRVLEAVARTGRLSGSTDILLQEGSEFQVVDRLLTNFHQPESTLLALVAGFSSLQKVKQSYAWAIERRFRLFSYGDLSVWLK